jgi:hypothetical protein
MRTNRILVACLSLVLALALVAPALAGSAKRKVVGKVTAIGGSKNIKIRATPKGPGRAVKVGTKLTLGATSWARVRE